MGSAVPIPRPIRFGVFEVDLKAGEIRKNGIKLKLSGQPFQILTILLSRPGELVTREELQKQLWPDTFVDAERNLNTAVNKIREVLGDSAENPRFVETLPRRGYRFIAPVDGIARPASPSNSQSAELRRAPRLLRWVYVIGGAALVLGVVLLAFHYDRTPATMPSQRALTRVTFDPGLQIGAAWSPDGRFVAYSSNRSGKLEIWVQQLGGGGPVQVTHGPGLNWQPDWSPDGRYIAYRSEGPEGGLYIVPALGGAGLERKLSSFGYYPHWSPDSSKILFQTSRWAQGSNFYVVRLDGTPPQQVLREFLENNHLVARSATWHPDGHRITLWIFNSSGAVYGNEVSFWTVTGPNGETRRTELTPELAAQLHEVSLIGQPEWEDDLRFRWSPSADALYFERTVRGSRNLWKLRVDPVTLKPIAIERLTTDANLDMEFALSSDGKRLVFTAEAPDRRVWIFPFDPIRGHLMGNGKPITSIGENASVATLTRDGSRLAFGVMRAGRWELREASLSDGQERPIIADDYLRGFPTWSPDGKFLAYWRTTPSTNGDSISPEQLFIWSTESRTETPASLPGEPTPHWAHIVFDWSPDGKILLSSEHPSTTQNAEIWRRPAASIASSSEEARKVTSDPNRDLWQAHFSPDGKWIVIEGERATPIGNESRLFVAPSSGGSLIPLIRKDESDKGLHWDDKPRWSPDGRTIYFLSDRSGFFNIWGVRFDPAKAAAVGEPFQISYFDTPDLMLPAGFIGSFDLSISRDELALNLSQRAGNLWVLDDVEK